MRKQIKVKKIVKGLRSKPGVVSPKKTLSVATRTNDFNAKSRTATSKVAPTNNISVNRKRQSNANDKMWPTVGHRGMPGTPNFGGFRK